MSRSWAARLGPAAAFQFCFIAAVAMLKPAANALVLSRFQSDALPWLYLGASLITGGLAVVGAKSGGRRSTPSFLVLSGGLASLLFAAGLKLEVPLVALGAYLFTEAFATQVSLSFWAALGEAFDAREARRAFTWINGVGMSGAIIGGLGAQVLARTWGALAMMAAGAALLLLGAAAWRFHKSALEPSAAPRGQQPKMQWAAVLRAPYTQMLAWLVLGFSVLQQLTDYVFRERAVSTLVEADMAALFASHQLWTGVFCVVFQFAAAEVLLRKLGIIRYVALLPAAIGALTVVTWAVPSVWSALALKVFEGASSWSMLPVAIQLLYAPLPDEQRDAARRTIDGVLRKGGMGLAGILLLGLAKAVGLIGVFGLVIAVCAALGVVLWRIRPRYIEAVHDRVAGVQPGSLEVEERLLVEALKSPSAERALRAADLLEHAGLATEAQVKLMLEHSHERVQERGVRLAIDLGAKGMAKQLEALLASPHRRPRDSAVWALAKLNPDRARDVLPAHLASTDVGLLSAAVGGLLSLPGAPHPRAQQALELLLARGPRAPAAERREVARLLGRLGDPKLTHALQAYLEDSDPSVRRIAITSAGEGRYVELAPRLLRFLSWRDDRRAAREALALLGDAVVPLLRATLDDRSRTLSLRNQLPRVLRRIETQAALDALLFSNAVDEPALHYRVGVALAQLHDARPDFTVDVARVTEAITRRTETYTRLVGAYRDCRAALGDVSLLSRVIGDRLDQALELEFWLLGLEHDARALRRAHAHLVGNDTRRRAWALEFLDNLLSPAERALIAQQLEAHHRSLPWGAGARLPEHLQLLTFSDDLVLRACARKVARWMNLWDEPQREDDMNEATVKKLFALEGVEIFAQSDVDDLAAVAAVAREQTFRKGEQVYAEGDPGDALYVIVEGAAEARRDGEVVLTMREKESFGETSLFDGAPRINEVVALADTRTLVIDRRDFLDLLGDRPELLGGMFRVLSRQLKSMVVDLAASRANTGDFPAVGGPPVQR